jgi:hypothetical protein
MSHSRQRTPSFHGLTRRSSAGLGAGGASSRQASGTFSGNGEDAEDSQSLAPEEGGQPQQLHHKGRMGRVVARYDAIASNRLKSSQFSAAAAELSGSNKNLKSGKELVLRLRELSFRVGEIGVINGDFMSGLVRALAAAKDKDWDRKAVRHIQYFLRAMVQLEGDTKGVVLGCQAEGRKIGPRHVMEAMDALLEELHHVFIPRRALALQTMAILSQALASEEKPLHALKLAVDSALEEYLSADPGPNESSGKKVKKKAKVKAEGNHRDRLLVTRAIFSAVHRTPTLADDPDMLSHLLTGCQSEDAVAARHAFAALQSQVRIDALRVSNGIYLLLQPTTIATAGISLHNHPNLTDELACTYYLRVLKALVFSPEIDNQARLDFYRTIANSVPDLRHGVAMEAMRCLMDHDRAWQLLIDAQRESHDVDIFRRVVDRLKACFSDVLATCKWPLAHAACRVCKVVGETLQRAISYETIQEKLRDQSTVTEAATSVPLFFSSTPGSSSRPSDAPGERDGTDRPMTPTLPPVVDLLELPLSPPDARNGDALLIDLPQSPRRDSQGLALERSNKESIRGLCDVLWGEGLLDCAHKHVRSLALQALFLLVPDPDPKDALLTELWTLLQQKVEACPKSLPEGLLAELVTSLLVRVDCSAASRIDVIPIVLHVAESFRLQLPTDGMSDSLMKAWVQCINYGPSCRALVLQSVYRALDSNLSGHADVSSSAAPSLMMQSFRAPSSGPPSTPAILSRRFSRTQSSSSRHGGIGTSKSSKRLLAESSPPAALAAGQPVNSRGVYSASGGTATIMAAGLRLKRLAFWLLGEYCCEFMGGSVPRAHEAAILDNPLRSIESSLLALSLVSSPTVPAKPVGESSDGKHPVLSHMNEATISMLLRLKQAAYFEDAATRHAAVVALCKVSGRGADASPCASALLTPFHPSPNRWPSACRIRCALMCTAACMT